MNLKLPELSYKGAEWIATAGQTLSRLAIALLFVLLLEGCSPSLPASPSPSPSPQSPPSPASPIAPPAALLNDIRAALSAETGISVAQISLKSAEAVDWNDSCLGLASPDEVCLMVITPGYRIILSTPTQDHEFHTDRQRSFRKVKPE